MIGGGKHKGSTSARGDQSWRSLAGGSKTTGVKSTQARKRRQRQMFKLCGLVLGLAAILGALVWGIITFQNREEPIQLATPSQPVKKILFHTDGVLPDQWLDSAIDLRSGMTLMEVDIHEMKRLLESQGQVKTAAVEREFPDALKIVLKERIPVLRMKVAGADDRPELRIVARDGTIYKGEGYSTDRLSELPYVVPYRYPGGGVQPMRGIDKVADLIDVARRTQPAFFKTWRSVNLKYYSGDPDLAGQVIEVKSSTVPRLIFGTRVDFAQQLERLAVILNYVQSRGNPAIKRIDLSLQDSAAVQFESGRISTF